ncbi:hypothetical protein JHD50_00635 [Sulfurimonas sp. MAG313]|nr:hypothetical protein [Sulfurimonas sp. MAG313]MDF1879820.1 hypothetical protein [Sulfurimonas sp. MAG313]
MDAFCIENFIRLDFVPGVKKTTQENIITYKKIEVEDDFFTDLTSAGEFGLDEAGFKDGGKHLSGYHTIYFKDEEYFSIIKKNYKEIHVVFEFLENLARDLHYASHGQYFALANYQEVFESYKERFPKLRDPFY